MSAVEVTGLGLTYRSRPPVAALRHVDLEAAEGGLVAVLGPSGCGKTTLLRCIAGLERPDVGEIRIGDRLVDGPGRRVAAERRQVGLVPQEGALFPHLDVGRNVAFGLRGVERAARRRRVDEMLELVGLPGTARRRPHELSGGQQQRVALARALAPEPAVILLDEPFSALDAGLRTALRLEVASLLRERGTTALLVTHDQVEAMSMADHVAVMRAGEIVQDGRPDDVYHRPVDAWTASFLGDAIRLPGRRDGDVVDGPLGRLPLAVGVSHHPGPDVTIFLRPEQVRPASDASGTTVRAAIAATVAEVLFQGPDVLVALDLGGSVARITARWPSTAPVAPGDAVRLDVIGSVLAHPPTASRPGERP